MKKHKFKLRISNMFQSSYASCNSKNNNNDVLEKPQNLQNCQLIQLFSLTKPFISFNKPKKLEFFQTQENFKLNIECPPRSKITEQQHLLHPAENAMNCLKLSPVSPLNSLQCQRKNKPKRNKTSKPRARSKSFNILDFQGFSYNGLFSSDEDTEDEDKTTTFFTSRSLSTLSSESYKRNNHEKTRKELKTIRRRNRGAEKHRRTHDRISNEKKGSLNLTGSFAVVKRSRDPYNDFKASMVEMIIEKSILSAEDLENMLHCFLSLNSNCHHRIIVQVFTEIWEALLSSSS